MTDATLDAAWETAGPKPLLRIGKDGAKASHRRSLHELVAAHGTVKVRFGRVETLERDEAMLDLASGGDGGEEGGEGGGSEGDVFALMVKGKMVLYCSAERLERLRADDGA